MKKIISFLTLLIVMCVMTIIFRTNLIEKDYVRIPNIHNDFFSGNGKTSSTKEIDQTNAANETDETNFAKETNQTNSTKETDQTNSAKETDQTNSATDMDRTKSAKETDQTKSDKETDRTKSAKETDQTNSAKETDQTNSTDDMYYNWIILMTVNTGFIDFFQNWFWYFQRHQLTVPVIVIAEDEVCFKKLRELIDNNRYSVTIESNGSNNTENAIDFGGKEFNKLVGERPAHILRKLEQGYNVLYSDTDSVWLRNPFPHLVGDFDIWAQMDSDVQHCTGFLAIKCNNRTLTFIEKWKSHMVELSKTTNDQIGFQQIDKSKVRIKGLNTDLFPAGFQYFKEPNITKYANTVVVHNNFIVGHDRKKERFIKFNIWHQTNSTKEIDQRNSAKETDQTNSAKETDQPNSAEESNQTSSTKETRDDMYYNWIILMTVNTGFIDFFQNWFWYFQKHQLTVPVIVIAEDEVCFKKLRELYDNNRYSVTIESNGSNNTENAIDFGGKEFNKLVGERPAHILRKLEQGYNVLYSDTDSVCLRNPFPHLVGDFDIWAQMDSDVQYCTGFLAIKCNNRTLKFFERWKTHMVELSKTTNDQIGFEQIDKSYVRIKGLNTDLFPAGFQYFKEPNNTKYANTVVVHNNFIVGHDRKKERFIKFNIWHQTNSTKEIDQRNCAKETDQTNSAKETDQPNSAEESNQTSSTKETRDDMYYNWIILMTVNTGFIDFFQNWFWYFQKHQLTVPVIVIAEDEVCFKKLRELYDNNRYSVTIESNGSNNTENAIDFGGKEFNKLVGERPAHILRKLEQGYNVLYSDTDSVWLRNPFPHLVGDFDIWAQMDSDVQYCTGFLAIKCNNRTLKFFERWKTHMVELSKTTNDQIGFEQIDKSYVRIKGLNTDLFPAGFQYFKELNDTKYANTVVVHNNFIVGHDRKKERFIKFNIWHQ